MLERCFYQFQNTASISTLEKKQMALEEERQNIVVEDESTVKEYYDVRKQLDQSTADMRSVIMHPSYCLMFLQSGRLVHIKYGDHDFGWGAVVNFSERRPGKGQEKGKWEPQESYILDVLIPVASDASIGTKLHSDLPEGIRPPPSGDKGKMEVIPVLLS